MSGNAGRSTTGDAAVPYYSESEAREIAKHLRLTADRFLRGTATDDDLDKACEMWRAARHERDGKEPAGCETSDK